MKMIGFIVPNQTSKRRVYSFAVSVDKVEQATGYDFFSQLDDELENSWKRKQIFTNWKSKSMKKQTDTFKRLRSVIKDVNGDNRQIIKTMQEQIEYLMEFIDIQGEILEEKTGSRQPELSIEQKKRLAHRGKKLNEFLLGQIENTFAPSTVMKW